MADFERAYKSVENDNRNKRKKRIKTIVIAVVIVIIAFALITNRNFLIGKAVSFKDVVSMLTGQDKFTAQLIDKLPDNVSKIAVNSIEADTTLTTPEGVSYVAENLLDSDKNTTWQDGADDFGKGNVIKLSFTEKIDISYLVIYNGNQISAEHFENNNRLKEIIIRAGNRTATVELADIMGPQFIKLGGINECDSISIEIRTVYEGSIYNDTCISEIECYK